ncbi:MAG TPA: hypothetical protein VMM76_19370 [Pirellulaceae bacterium]|nr:hypothetical protein [Pirellulaceae bacterium]
MLATQRLFTATSDAIRQELFQMIAHLLQTMRQNQELLEQLQQVRDLIEALPLATSEYGTAANRLRNAHRYLVSQERGAARYELQVLAGTLRPDVPYSATPARPRTRHRTGRLQSGRTGTS